MLKSKFLLAFCLVSFFTTDAFGWDRCARKTAGRVCCTVVIPCPAKPSCNTDTVCENAFYESPCTELSNIGEASVVDEGVGSSVIVPKISGTDKKDPPLIGGPGLVTEEERKKEEERRKKLDEGVQNTVPNMRKWTSGSQEQVVIAAFLRVEGDTAIFRKADGKLAKAKLSQLSAEDQELIVQSRQEESVQRLVSKRL